MKLLAIDAGLFDRSSSLETAFERLPAGLQLTRVGAPTESAARNQQAWDELLDLILQSDLCLCL